MDTEDSNIKTLKDEEIITKSVVSRRSLFSTGVLLLSAATVFSKQAAASDRKNDSDQTNTRQDNKYPPPGDYDHAQYGDPKQHNDSD